MTSNQNVDKFTKWKLSAVNFLSFHIQYCTHKPCMGVAAFEVDGDLLEPEIMETKWIGSDHTYTRRLDYCNIHIMYFSNSVGSLM